LEFLEDRLAPAHLVIVGLAGYPSATLFADALAQVGAGSQQNDIGNLGPMSVSSSDQWGSTAASQFSADLSANGSINISSSAAQLSSRSGRALTYVETYAGYLGGTYQLLARLDPDPSTNERLGDRVRIIGTMSADATLQTGPFDSVSNVQVDAQFDGVYLGRAAFQSTGQAFSSSASIGSTLSFYFHVKVDIEEGGRGSADLHINYQIQDVGITPAFSNLSAPAITYGTASNTVSGHLNSNGSQPVPAGEPVQVTLNGSSQTGILDGGDNFSATFDTSTLSAANSPYTIGFSYGGDSAFTSATASSTLVVNQATPTFSNLSAPEIAAGTPTTIISGHLDANAGQQTVPAGEAVQVTLNGVKQPATLDSQDDFSTTFDTSALNGAGSPYTIDFTYGGDANFSSASGSSELTVSADLVANSLAWHTNPADAGGVDLSYSVNGAPLPADTTVALYWADGTTLNDTLEPLDQPVWSQPISTGTQPGNYGLNVPAVVLGTPPPGSEYLLLVADPNNVLGSFDPNKNLVSLVYDPTVKVTAKYDGDPSDAIMGRYFSGTDALKDNFFSIVLSDSLDALRPTAEVKIGDQILAALPSPTQPDTFITATFDPGSLSPGQTPLIGEAFLGGQDIADFSSTLLVEPLPTWVKALNGLNIKFDPNGDGLGGDGAYVMTANLPELRYGGSSFTIPSSVPFVGGTDISAGVGFSPKVIAPLAVTSVPTTDVGDTVQLRFGPDLEFNTTLTVSTGAPLDPLTLEEPGGFSLTIALDTKAPIFEKELFSRDSVVFPFGIPVFVHGDVKAGLALHFHAQAQLVLDSSNQLDFVGRGTYLSLGVEASLTGTLDYGWQLPPSVQKAVQYILQRLHLPNALPEAVVKDVATASVNAQGTAYFDGPVTSPTLTDACLSGDYTLSDKLSLELSLGSRKFTLPILSPKTKGELFNTCS
jgi:hypothetical protein